MEEEIEETETETVEVVEMHFYSTDPETGKCRVEIGPAVFYSQPHKPQA